MSNSNLGYAFPLYEVSKNIGKEVYQQLLELHDIFSENKEFSELLSTYSIPLQRRFTLLDEVFNDSVDKNVLNFLKVLVAEKRLSEYSNIVESYKEIFYEDTNIMEVEIVTAVPLKDEYKHQIILSLEKKYNKKIIPIVTIDKTIYGGIKIKTKTSVLDKGIDKELEDLRRTFLRTI